jgi:hypothetical protein
MKTVTRLLIYISALFLTTAAIAQDSTAVVQRSATIPVEVLFGNNRLVGQITMNKKFCDSTRFGFIASSYFAADYDNDLRENESMNILLLSYDIYKGLGIVSGAALNSKWGFRPFAGGMYSYRNKGFFTTFSSGFYLTESNNFETKAVFQYRHPLKANWSLIYRVEGLYNQDMDTKKHDRAQLYGRLGVSYNEVGIGFATNLDWYGPSKVFKENYGVFVSYAFR